MKEKNKHGVVELLYKGIKSIVELFYKGKANHGAVVQGLKPTKNFL